MKSHSTSGLAAIAFCVAAVHVQAAPTVADSARPAPEQIPMLQNKIGLGLTWGALNYIGDYPNATSIYARGTLRWNPWEWLALRAVGGGGLAWSNKAEGNLEIFDGAVSLVLQPSFHSRFRPYIASGFGLASIVIAHDFEEVDPVKNDLREGMRIGYIPLELGLEYLLTEHVSLSLMAETYIAASDADLWDGVNKPGEVGSFDLDKRDEIQRFGMGVTFYVDPAPDSDKDGVKNRVDRCPNTPKGLVVDALGCPMDSDGDGTPDFKDKCPATPRGAKADSAGCPLDSDADGIADYQDKCPATPAGVRVGSEGCPLDSDADKIADFQDKCPNTPAGVEVDNVGCPKDTDADGVADVSDKCPNSPVGLPVDASGCSKDEDADGVADGLDKCSGTPAGTEVDSIGCQRIRIASGVNLTLQGVWFKSGKSELVDSSRAALARAAVAIAKAPGVKIEIAGHTDEKGSPKLNQALSQARAATVRLYLIALGIPSEQLVAKGYGSTQPLAPNKTEAGRAMNRRIEFHVK
jgi:outer membrane protein OmpA-like peptidoglycan-associated protein